MRKKSLVLAVAQLAFVLTLLAAPVAWVAGGFEGAAWAQEQPPANPPANPPAQANPPANPPDVKVEVKTTETDSGWAIDPFWMVVGGVAAVVIIGLIVAASRPSSGGATVIKT